MGKIEIVFSFLFGLSNMIDTKVRWVKMILLETL